MEEKKISLLIPCFNAERFIERLLLTAIAQTVPFAEIICYDDCSFDSTVSVIQQFPQVKLIKGIVNKGPSFARNQLIIAANSDWIHFHDSDDILDFSFVEKATPFLGSEDVQLLCNCGTIDKQGRKKMALEYLITVDDDPVRYFLNHVGLAIVGVYNRNFLLKKNIFFDENLRYNEDPDFHVRLANSGARFVAINATLVYLVGHDESVSIKGWWNCICNQIYCFNRYQNILDPTYHNVLSSNLARLAYYSYRGKKWKIAYRAEYSLKKRFDNRFSFNNRWLDLFKNILGTKFFFLVTRYASNLFYPNR